jgi:CDP-diacylglycerol--glycerol-3-phosphate 3-phosphatidyltransferase
MIDGRRSRAQREQPKSAKPSRIGTALARIGVSADAITVLGICLAAGTGVLIGSGHFWIATAMLIVGGLMDTLDGVVAKAAGTTSIRGAFFDSVSDRVADGLIFGGVTWRLLVGHNPREALLPVAILVVSSIVSYERAKAESLGLSAKGGLMERAERLILLGVALFFHVVLIPLLIVLLVLTSFTACGRFIRVWRQAERPEPTIEIAPIFPTSDHSRWRSFKDSDRIDRHRARRQRRAREPFAVRLRHVLDTEPTTMKRPATRRAARAIQARMSNDR